MELEIRRAGIADHGKVTSLVREFATEHCRIFPADPDRFDLVIAGILKDNSWLLLEALSGGEVLGLAAVEFRYTLLGQQEAHIRALYVRGHYRGQGVGSRLLEAATLHSQRRGCASIKAELGVQDASRGFFSRMGFSYSGEVMSKDTGEDQPSLSG